MKKTPQYTIELIPQPDILRKLKNQFGQLPDPLDFVLEKNRAFFGLDWYDESALKAIEHMANDPDAHFFEVLTYLKRLTEIKDKLLKRYRLTHRTLGMNRSGSGRKRAIFLLRSLPTCRRSRHAG